MCRINRIKWKIIQQNENTDIYLNIRNEKRLIISLQSKYESNHVLSPKVIDELDKDR